MKNVRYRARHLEAMVHKPGVDLRSLLGQINRSRRDVSVPPPNPEF